MTVVTALSGLLGVLIGAVLTYWLGIRAEAAKAHQKQRTDAYIEFIEAVAAVATSQRTYDQSRLDEASTRIIQAKSKIAVYGSRPVAEALAEFLKTHGSLNSKEAFRSFAAIVALMRADLPGEPEPLTMDDLLQLLFKEDLPFRE